MVELEIPVYTISDPNIIRMKTRLSMLPVDPYETGNWWEVSGLKRLITFADVK